VEGTWAGGWRRQKTGKKGYIREDPNEAVAAYQKGSGQGKRSERIACKIHGFKKVGRHKNFAGIRPSGGQQQ